MMLNAYPVNAFALNAAYYQSGVFDERFIAAALVQAGAVLTAVAAVSIDAMAAVSSAADTLAGRSSGLLARHEDTTAVAEHSGVGPLVPHTSVTSWTVH